MPAFPKPYADLVARLRVPSGFLLIAVFGWFSDPTGASLLCGFPVCLAGLALRGWAAGCLAKNQQLATGGPYAHTRNPLYLGSLLMAAGLVIAARSLGLGILAAAVFGLVYLPVIQNEQQHLRKIFAGYSDYAARVPALWPRFSRAYAASNCFRWSLYRKNQEYQAGAAFLVAAVFLFWKLVR